MTGLLPESRRGQQQPGHDQGRAAQGGDGAQGGEAGEGQQVERACEEQQAGGHGPAGGPGQAGLGLEGADESHGEQAQAVGEVVEDGGVVDVEHARRQRGAQGVGPEGAQADGGGGAEGAEDDEGFGGVGQVHRVMHPAAAGNPGVSDGCPCRPG